MSALVWKIDFDPRTEKELRKIAHRDAKRIFNYLRDRMAVLDDPRQLGKPLSGSLGELWRYRVEDYRIIASIDDHEVRVLMIRVGHQREVYR